MSGSTFQAQLHGPDYAVMGAYICRWYLSRFGLALMIGGVLFAVFWRRLSLTTFPGILRTPFQWQPRACDSHLGVRQLGRGKLGKE